ncbi:hypothetical protein M569_15514 [Genlisea aurea]|uniref:Uncharacterized protein n=1 Tax=Genlisea aurea TaxID=192259 RepID=S8BY00_9LAMI|nr:hypothetical protein M569_15514 [Genlisea aurea]
MGPSEFEWPTQSPPIDSSGTCVILKTTAETRGVGAGNGDSDVDIHTALRDAALRNRTETELLRLLGPTYVLFTANA